MKQLLLMEDDLSLSVNLIDRLKGYGFSVDAYRNASDALAALKSRRYDVVVTDLIVKHEESPTPDGGITLVGKLNLARRNRESYARVPIVAISGVANIRGKSYLLNVAERNGADAVLEKPFAIEELVTTINALMTDPQFN